MAGCGAWWLVLCPVGWVRGRGMVVSVEDLSWYVLSEEDLTIWDDDKFVLARNPDAIVSLSVRTPELTYEQHPMPELPGWKHQLHSINDPAGAFRPHRANAHFVSLFKDFRQSNPMCIVSGRAKALIEPLDPEGNEFHAFSYIDYDTGEMHHPDYWYWLPRRRFRYAKRQVERPEGTRRSEFGLVSGPAAWDLSNNRQLREFLREIPICGWGMAHYKPIFRSDVYRMLIDAGMTGLDLVSTKFVPDRKKHETVVPL